MKDTEAKDLLRELRKITWKYRFLRAVYLVFYLLLAGAVGLMLEDSFWYLLLAIPVGFLFGRAWIRLKRWEASETLRVVFMVGFSGGETPDDIPLKSIT